MLTKLKNMFFTQDKLMNIRQNAQMSKIVKEITQ